MSDPRATIAALRERLAGSPRDASALTGHIKVTEAAWQAVPESARRAVSKVFAEHACEMVEQALDAGEQHKVPNVDAVVHALLVFAEAMINNVHVAELQGRAASASTSSGVN